MAPAQVSRRKARGKGKGERKHGTQPLASQVYAGVAAVLARHLRYPCLPCGPALPLCVRGFDVSVVT